MPLGNVWKSWFSWLTRLWRRGGHLAFVRAAHWRGKEMRRTGAEPAEGKVSMKARQAKYAIGQVVRHRLFPFRGIIFDVDPVFANTEEWWQSIPEEIRPAKEQPFYHLLAENAETEYVAYVSEQNLLPDESRDPLRHPQLRELFEELEEGVYRFRQWNSN
jgi:heat shock protein HspQ